MEKLVSTLATIASTASLLRMFRPRHSHLATTIVSHSATFLAGVVVGTAAGLLLAPKSGRDLRADLRRGARDVKEGLQDTATTVSQAAKRVVSTAKPDGASVSAEAGTAH